MRVNSRMRARASRVSTSAAILAAFALGAVSLTGCGQKGPLYMPNVPPMPQKPNFETQPAPDDQARAASDAQVGTIPDTSGTPLSLSPDPELNSVPASAASATPASAAAPAQ
ncbi:putative small lipoprotein YifL [Paraburkholderia bannensis]|jgi:predicted small lipoprotein YifL|uniref:Putative small lipoprotein YifL n=1 Tax=Paraburkholderia bannensis TaxID=765414 RepID=A0A7W9U3X7_9BURK|nr:MULTISPECIES: lipoprotein [Paraburkholderia]MBB3260449.1 putative small lipoprotein YifL [Paraburkholderia sp. WP4_3_2]MBB6105485.1 putative small lipoprotein YifL [Paraburkholderia bannensis]